MKTNFVKLKGNEQIIMEYEDENFESTMSALPAGIYKLLDVV